VDISSSAEIVRKNKRMRNMIIVEENIRNMIELKWIIQMVKKVMMLKMKEINQ
jgi:hypothetical protein